MKSEVTIYDIANQLKLSPTTVSRSLNDHPAVNKTTKTRVLKAAKKMQYRPNTFACNLRSGQTKTIGVLIPRIHSEFMSKAVTSIEKVMNEAGYATIISQSAESHEKEILNATGLYNNGIDGLIVSLANSSKSFNHLKDFVKKKIPVVMFDRVCDEIDGIKITVDDKKAAYEIATHLLNSGKKRIAFLTGSRQRNVFADRFAGFEEALKSKNLRASSSLIKECDLTMNCGRKLAKKLMLQDEKPDAIFCCNDPTAVGVIMQLKEMNIKIPEQVAVTGFNNDVISSVIEPKLTTADHPITEMGKIAAERLLETLEKPNIALTSQLIILPCKLIIRESS